MAVYVDERKLCLAYITKNYDQWPSRDTLSAGQASHYGYSWFKRSGEWPWVLVNSDLDSILESDYNRAFYDNLKMSDYFKHTEEPDLEGMCPSEEVTLTFSVKQARAMFHAIRQHDIMKEKLSLIKRATKQLTREIGE